MYCIRTILALLKWRKSSHIRPVWTLATWLPLGSDCGRCFEARAWGAKVIKPAGRWLPPLGHSILTHGTVNLSCGLATSCLAPFLIAFISDDLHRPPPISFVFHCLISTSLQCNALVIDDRNYHHSHSYCRFLIPHPSSAALYLPHYFTIHIP